MPRRFGAGERPYVQMARYFRTAPRWFCLVVVVAGVSLEAQTASVPICKLLDELTSFRNQSVAVSGELVGSFRHGFYLAPEGRAETCPSWPESGFTRPALIALTFPWAGSRLVIPPEFLG